jgi:plastocyanin
MKSWILLTVFVALGLMTLAVNNGARAADESPSAMPSAAGAAASPATMSTSTPSAEATKPAEEAAKPAMESKAGSKEFTLVSEMVGKTKFWLPSTINVEQGDHVKLNLRNEVPGNPNQHGFQLSAFNITELVTRGEPKTVEFTADKVGIFPYVCHVHPPHVGGQVVVHPKGEK